MPATLLGSLRKRLVTPHPSEVLFSRRGFDVTQAPAREKLEASALQFIVRFELGIEHSRDDEIVTRLEMLDPEFRVLPTRVP